MTKVAEVTFSLDSGATVIDYISAKTPKAFGKQMDKMLRKGAIKLGPVTIVTESIMQIECKFHEVQ